MARSHNPRRQAGDAPPPEMIEAIAVALGELAIDLADGFLSPYEAAERVWQAMRESGREDRKVQCAICSLL